MSPGSSSAHGLVSPFQCSDPPAPSNLSPLSPPLTSLSPICVAGADEISPKVLQALGSEPIQVRPRFCGLRAAWGLLRAWAENEGLPWRPRGPSPSPHPTFHPQYAVPVVKYDRKGYKARSRQLLLTPSAVVIVEDAKVKQRIDYTNLTGEREPRAA